MRFFIQVNPNSKFSQKNSVFILFELLKRSRYLKNDTLIVNIDK